MPGFDGLIKNLSSAIRHPAQWRLSREAITQRGAIQHVDELTPFAKLVADLQPRVVLEIGTAQGGVFWLLCRLAAPEACLISLDLPPDDRHSGGERRQIDLQSCKRPAQKVHAILGDSHTDETLQRVRQVLGDREIDLLFIDGDHTYNGVKRDFQMYSPLVRKGGIVAFHDIVNTPWPECNVDRFWAEVSRDASMHPLTYVSKHRSHFGGIGVLTKPAS